MKVLYHNDLDGQCAAAIVLVTHPGAECIEVSYDRDVPWDKIQKDEDVIIVDFSLQKEGEWEKLRSITQKIIWIDHHETSINKAPDWLKLDCDGLQSTRACGALLTWQYFRPLESIPEIVKVVDAWDRWVHNDEPYVLDFVSGAESYDTSPESEFWEGCFRYGSARIEVIGGEGETISRYKKIQNANNIKELAYQIMFENYRCLVLHGFKCNSKVFESVWGEYDIYISIKYNGHLYTVSLYSDKVKVNDIAVKYGGGGHPGAAGFQCQELPWTPSVREFMAVLESFSPGVSKKIEEQMALGLIMNMTHGGLKG